MKDAKDVTVKRIITDVVGKVKKIAAHAKVSAQAAQALQTLEALEKTSVGTDAYKDNAISASRYLLKLGAALFDLLEYEDAELVAILSHRVLGTI